MAIQENVKEAYKKEYLDFLKEQLEEHCGSGLFCEIYWDYRDEMDASTIQEAIDKYKESGFATPKDYLSNRLWELNLDYDSGMFDEIEKAIRNCDNEHVIAYFEEFGDLREDALSVGYNGIDDNINGLLSNSSFHVNVMFATDEERNQDMGSIVDAFGSYREPDFNYIANMMAEGMDVTDNALTYFIHQQGHSVREVYECLLGNPRGFGSADEMNFARAVVNDIVNNSSEAMSELVALVKLDGNGLLDLLEAVEKGERFLTFDKQTEMGIFNEWSGCGGCLDFELDKPFVVPTSMVRNVQLEGTRDNGCTVDQVYGLIGSCWKPTLGYTDEAPALYKEDMAATVKDMKDYVEQLEANDFEAMLSDAIEAANATATEGKANRPMDREMD